MNEKKPFLLIVLINLVSLFLLAGCIGTSTVTPTPTIEDIYEGSDIRFSTLVPASDTNKSIMLSYDPFRANDFKIGSDIYLQISNQSAERIWFPVGSNIEIFQWTNDSWVFIPNSVHYSGRDTILAPLDDDDELTVKWIDLIPIIENQGENVTLRISVSGIIYEDGAPIDKEVAANLDVELTP